jgi:Adenine/guanine phosphoribosyltransferases and related PRPP-binding proteins
MELLRKSVRECPVVSLNGYEYFIHPISDGVPSVDPALLREVINGMSGIFDFDCDLILTPEAMGIHLAAPLSMALGVPYSVIRKRSYGLPDEIRISKTTGYSKSEMFMNGVHKGMRVAVVDDVVSTGGTLRSMINAVRSVGADVVGVVSVFDKSQDIKELERSLNVPVRALMRIRMTDGRMEII